ncbi:MAG: hypothetical protein JW779_04045 [Candidatus Thorarchaeota archaeon]|nr:hypothetical protein [Candidatus Thorarchaeota archaeon]
MTIRIESASLSVPIKECACGQCSCIILYTSPKCILCNAALEILYSVISDFGLSQDVVSIVDITSEEEACNIPPTASLPAMKICQELLTGLPDLDVARGAVMHAVLKGCFSN